MSSSLASGRGQVALRLNQRPAARLVCLFAALVCLFAAPVCLFAAPVCLFAAMAAGALPLRATVPAPAETASQLVRQMVYNEVRDRERDSYWSYRVARQTPQQSIVAWQVETSEGPIFRVLARNGKPLERSALEQEDARLDELLNSRSELEKNRVQHRGDEERLQRLMKLMPDAFLYSYDGTPTGDEAHIRFQPNPAFVPQTWEARVYHGLAGTLLVDTRQKRMKAIDGKLVERIDFGYGLFGHIDKGGTFQVHRVGVTPAHWKTTLVNIDVDGRIILFKTVSRQQREERSEFSPVPVNISMGQVRNILDGAQQSADKMTRAATR